jgi:hypothetical protein
MNEPVDRLQGLIQLFQETGSAHHQAFIDTDGADPEWPIWYAGYLHERLCRLLGANFTKSELVYLIVLAAKELALRAPGKDWVRYYAQFFFDRYH